MMSQIPGETPPPNLATLAEDHYFSANPPPKDLEKHVKQAKDFIDFHAKEGRRLVLITSGGTTVPLGEFFSFPFSFRSLGVVRGVNGEEELAKREVRKRGEVGMGKE